MSNTVSLEQTIEGESRIPDGLSDSSFTVLVPDRFMSVDNRTPQNIEPNTRIATYTVVQSGINDKKRRASRRIT